MRRDKARLLDIIEAINNIEKYYIKGKKAFEEDELIQTWMVYHIQIIGEAASKLSSTIQETYTEVPWPEVVAMRNILVHEYFGIDLIEVWSTVEIDIPNLKEKITKIIEKLDS